jgi:hypothetical protein
MRYLPIITIFLILQVYPLTSQSPLTPAHDNVWLFGDKEFNQANYFGGTKLDFSNSKVKVNFLKYQLIFMLQQ